MRPNGLRGTVLALLVAVFDGPARAQAPPPPPDIPVSGRIQLLAERVFDAVLADRRAGVIAAEAPEFADRMAALYLGDGEGDSGSGPDWRAEVARIHDPGRVQALLLGALQARLAANPEVAARLQASLGATGVAAGTDGQGLELSARVELTRPAALQAAARRHQAAVARDAPALAAIRRMIDREDPVQAALALRMNREIGFARGFIAGGGYDFPAELADVAEDLVLQQEELRAQVAAHEELIRYAAFAPLGADAIARIAAARDTPRSRMLRAILSLAEGDVLDQLAAECGRAAVRRQEGSPL